ncbi:hypothetical protein HZC53_01225 [Candidatus Uhrbacteria bacterium]|nr:hypothetical protein [Candidatus Uhrbacteria bacterium]
MVRIGIVSAPLSTLNKKQPRLSIDLERLVSRSGLLFVTRTADELDSALLEFSRCGVQVIAVNGGDGTIGRVLTGALRFWPADKIPDIIPLRGGNFNVLANNLGVRGSPKVLLERLLAALDGPVLRRVARRTLLIGDRCGFQFANGSTGRFLEYFYRNKGTPLESLRLLADLWRTKSDPSSDYWRLTKAERTVIETDGRVRYDKPSLSVICSTLERMAYGQRMFRQTGSGARHFQCVTFDCQPSAVLSGAILDSFVRQASSPQRTSICADKMRITSPGNRLYSLDGEIYEQASDALDIKLGPSFSFVTL